VMTEAQVRSIVAEAIAGAPANDTVAALDAATLNPMIENYILANPAILQRAGEALQQEIRVAEAARAKAAISAMHAQIYDDPDHVILGNPNGDVTLVEMFDYNCHFCREALPDLATLIAEDPNLKVVLKEFPILSDESIDAARIGVLVSEADVDYWSFHQKLFTSRGQVSLKTALDAAKDLGLNPVELQLEAMTPRVSAIIEKSYALARQLNISGTPTYIIGDEIIPGMVGLDGLRQRIAGMRECGRTDCTLPDTVATSTAPIPENG